MDTLFEAPSAPPDVDADLCRTIVGLVLTVIRAQHGRLTKQTLLRLITHAIEHVPDKMSLPPPAEIPFMADVPHLLTRWRSDPRYLREGRPKPLPLKGPEPSVQSLLHEVNPQLSLQGSFTLLRSCRLLKRAGPHLYLPKDIMVRTRGTPYQAPQHLRTLADVLANFDHNAAPVECWPSWRDQGPECPNFPISKLPEWEDYVFSQSRAQLSDYDAFLHRLELSRDPQEPTTRVGIRLVQYQRASPQQTPEFTDTVRKLFESLRAIPGNAAPAIAAEDRIPDPRP